MAGMTGDGKTKVVPDGMEHQSFEELSKTHDVFYRGYANPSRDRRPENMMKTNNPSTWLYGFNKAVTGDFTRGHEVSSYLTTDIEVARYYAWTGGTVVAFLIPKAVTNDPTLKKYDYGKVPTPDLALASLAPADTTRSKDATLT